MTCTHDKAVTKRYVGSTETYEFCPECFETFGGEETPRKKALLRDAARAQEMGLVSEEG